MKVSKIKDYGRDTSVQVHVLYLKSYLDKRIEVQAEKSISGMKGKNE